MIPGRVYRHMAYFAEQLLLLGGMDHGGVAARQDLQGPVHPVQGLLAQLPFDDRRGQRVAGQRQHAGKCLGQQQVGLNGRTHERPLPVNGAIDRHRGDYRHTPQRQCRPTPDGRHQHQRENQIRRRRHQVVGNAPGKQQKRGQPHPGQKRPLRQPQAQVMWRRQRGAHRQHQRCDDQDPGQVAQPPGEQGRPDNLPGDSTHGRDRDHADGRRHHTAPRRHPGQNQWITAALPQVHRPDIAMEQPPPQNGFKGIACGDERRCDQNLTQRAGPACQQDMQVGHECPQRHARPQTQAPQQQRGQGNSRRRPDRRRVGLR